MWTSYRLQDKKSAEGCHGYDTVRARRKMHVGGVGDVCPRHQHHPGREGGTKGERRQCITVYQRFNNVQQEPTHIIIIVSGDSTHLLKMINKTTQLRANRLESCNTQSNTRSLKQVLHENLT